MDLVKDPAAGSPDARKRRLEKKWPLSNAPLGFLTKSITNYEDVIDSIMAPIIGP